MLLLERLAKMIIDMTCVMMMMMMMMMRGRRTIVPIVVWMRSGALSSFMTVVWEAPAFALYIAAH